MLRAALPLLLLSLALAPGAAAQEKGASPKWLEDYDAAVQLAETQGKDLFVSFRGSDWCEFCALLEDEVFRHASWLSATSKDYVLVALDFPQAAEARSRVPHAARNTELADFYSVVQFPTVLLLDTSGVVFGELGYEEGGVEHYLALTQALQSTGKRILREANQIRDQWEDSKDHAALVKRSIGLLQDAVQGTQALAEIAEWARLAYTLDPDNKSGLKQSAVDAILIAGQGSNGDFLVATELDPENQIGLNERAAVARMDAIETEQHAQDWVNHVLSLRAMPRLHQTKLVQELAIYAAMFCRDYLDRMDDAQLLARWVKSLGEVPPEFKADVNALLQEA